MPYLNWTDFLNWNFHNIQNINENETVIFKGFDNFTNIVSFLKDLTEANASTKRQIANYLAWRLVFNCSDYLSEELNYRLNATQCDENKMSVRSEQCTKKTMKLYGNILTLLKLENNLNSKYYFLILQISNCHRSHVYSTIFRFKNTISGLQCCKENQ